MAFTIYTVSDPATVGAALQSMAMFFGQDGWVGSAIKTGLMLSLLFILAQGVTRNGLRLDVMLVQLLVVWAMFMPKTTVTVEQFDNAAPPRVVDDVPYAIALPASIAGAFALYMTNKIEAVMVNVDGDYLSISGGSHPFTPARALMAITMCPSDPMSCVDQNLVETMRLAARFCAGRELSTMDFRVKPDVLGAFADTMTLQAQVVIYDSTNPYIPGGGGGRVASCPEAAAHLRAVAEAERAGTGTISKAMNGLANRSEIKRYNSIARAQDNTERTWDEALNDINKLRDSNSKMDSLAFANVTLYALADTMKYSASAPIDQAITLRRDSSLFEWAKTEAHQSMLVSTTAPKFMDILFFVFIASTPIVMFVVAANPAGGLKVAGSYALFGLWTQSWIPMMAIVMSWYQGEIRNISSPVAMTPEYMAFFMRHAYTSTIAASNMIQQAPYLMFAIMTGSMFALSGMVSKAMPSGKGDASGVLKGGGGGGGGGSDVMNPGAKGGIPGAGMKHAIYGGQAAMAGGMTSSAVGMSGDGGAAYPSLPSLSASGAVQSGASLQSEQSAAVRKQMQTQAQQAYSELAQTVQSAAQKMGGQQLAQRMTDAGVKTSFDAKTGTLTTQYGSFDVGASQSNTKGQSAAARVGLEGSAGFVVLGTGAKASASIAGAVNEAVNQEVRAGNGKGMRNDKSTGTTEGTSVSSGSTASSGVSGTNGSEYGNTASKAKSLQDTFSKIASQAEALDKTDKAVTQAGQTAGSQVGQEAKGGDVVTNWASQVGNRFGSSTGNDGVALDRVASIALQSLTPDQKAAFTDAAAQKMKASDAMGSSIGLSRDQVAMAAAWSTLSDMSATASTPQQKISAQLGMAELSKAAGGADMTAGLKAVKNGLDKVSEVASNIADMGKKINGEVANAVSGADAKLNPAATDSFGKKVDADIAANKKRAEGLNARAQGGLAAVTAAGAKAQENAENNNRRESGKLLDMQPLVNATEQGLRNQSGAPQAHDISQFGAGNNTSINHKLFGSPEEGKNNGVMGAEGTGGVVPAKTLPSLIDGAAKEGQKAADGAMQWFSNSNSGNSGGGSVDKAAGMVGEAAKAAGISSQGVVDRAVSMVGDVSKSTGGSPSNAAGGSSTTVVMQGGAEGGLPKLGIDGGINLTPSGGGHAPAPTNSSQPTLSKPSTANRGGGEKSSPGAKTPSPKR